VTFDFMYAMILDLFVTDPAVLAIRISYPRIQTRSMSREERSDSDINITKKSSFLMYSVR
jgi:hypothetical protein